MERKHVFAIPAYGKPAYLEALLRSLAAQEVPSEILLCTATPNSHILDLAAKFHIPVFCREGSPSLKDDWNFAYKKGREYAPLVTIAHQDDLYYPGYSKAVLRAFRRYPDMSLFCCGYDTVDENGKKFSRNAESIKKMLRIPLRMRQWADRSSIKRSALLYGNGIACPSCTYQASLCGSPLFQNDYLFAIDWENLLRLANAPGRFVCVEKPLMAYRVHKDQETRKQIENHKREEEEREIFTRLHGKRGAELLLHFYKRAYTKM